VGEFGHREAAQVAHHHEDVLIDRVDMEQVVLHLADDAAEGRHVAAEDAVLVHAAQLVHQAARLLEELDRKAGPVDRIAAKVGPTRRRARHRARRVRAVMPFSSGRCAMSRKLSRMALGVRSNTSSVAHVEQFVAPSGSAH
jgi:hypothetical protein